MPIPTKALTCVWVSLCAILLVAISLPARAATADADDPPGRVARLSFLRGSVSFQPAGESDWVAATINRPMTTGDKLWADADSRAELHIGSAVIRLNGNTGFSFLNLDDRTVQIQLSAGTLGIRVRRLERDEIFEVDTPNQAFSILRPGQYRLEASEDGSNTTVLVSEGEGEATGGDRTYTIESRERASLTGTDTLSADIGEMDARDRDDFDDWCQERDRREDRSGSLRYVSPDMVGYEDLDENGVWRHDPEYGEVWVPRAPAGWAPYHDGHWAWISPWGWTWVDDAPWGYAPFHYGRWAYGRGAWFWVPGPVREEPVYAPALVAFVGGPGAGVGIVVGGGVAVGWFPLGPREVYVPAYRTSPDYVTRVNVSNTNVNRTTVTNVYNTTIINNNTTVVRNVTYVNRTAPGGVTAVPSNAFTSAQPVAAAAVRVSPSQIANAPVSTRAALAPTRNSVIGSPENRPGRPVPPGLMNRPVVAKTTPPPPPMSFERQQSALAAHPGQPLAHNEIETLRPANTPHPLVKQASPSQPQSPTPNRGQGQVARTPGTGRPDTPARENPANVRTNGSGNAATGNPAVNTPPRNDRPETGTANRPTLTDRPNAAPSYRPNQAAPVDARQNGRPEQPNRPEQPVNAPSPSPSPNSRPASNQPSYRPPSSPSSIDRPDQPNRPENQRPAVNPPPQSAHGVQPSDRRIEQPPNPPVSRPSPPATENRSPAPAPQPAPAARPIPNNRGAAPNPAPARSNNNSSNGKKENEKKN